MASSSPPTSAIRRSTFDEARPPLGALQAAHALGNDRFERLVTFASLSKRSNAPGLRTGFVAGDADASAQFLLYRTYHGNAMSPPVQSASIAAWKDEAHVVENRRLYAQKFAQAHAGDCAAARPVRMPDAAFYLWARAPIDDAEFARRLLAATNVTVLPGSYLSRDVAGRNPGAGHVRIALVAEAGRGRRSRRAHRRLPTLTQGYSPMSLELTINDAWEQRAA